MSCSIGALTALLIDDSGPGVWPWRQAADPLPVPGLSTAMRELNTHNGGKTLNPPRSCPLIAHQARYNDAETSDKLAA